MELSHTTWRSTHSFQFDYLDAWCDFYLYAAYASAGAKLEIPEDPPEQKLFLTWHCPEYPLFLPTLQQKGCLCLIAQQSDWMARAAGSESLYFFRNPSSVFGLVQAFRQRRPIVAMIDYCYKETAHAIADFLGYPARTPIGVFKLAERFGYQIEVVSLRDGSCAIIDSFPSQRTPLIQNVQKVNQVIQKEILSYPARWLLWPSIDNRWIGVN